MHSRIRADLMMFLAALIWGSAFVAQRMAMDHIGPFFYSGSRFLMGGLLLLFLMRLGGKQLLYNAPRHFWRNSVLLGIVLTIATNLQQIGLIFTTVANAGFITGLYVVLVPIAGIFLRHRIHIGTWCGAVLAAIGLYFLSVQTDFTVAKGDWFQLGGAFAWTTHVLLVGKLAKRYDAFALSAVQFITCGIISLLLSFFTESLNTASLYTALPMVIYGGLLSVGVGFTLQVVAQRDALASHAAVILSMESVFAALFGWWILGEVLSLRALLGCALMLIGMLAAQLIPFYFQKEKPILGHVQ